MSKSTKSQIKPPELARGGDADEEFKRWLDDGAQVAIYRGPPIKQAITMECGVNWCYLCCLLTIAYSKNKVKDVAPGIGFAPLM